MVILLPRIADAFVSPKGLVVGGTNTSFDGCDSVFFAALEKKSATIEARNRTIPVQLLGVEARASVVGGRNYFFLLDAQAGVEPKTVVNGCLSFP